MRSNGTASALWLALALGCGGGGAAEPEPIPTQGAEVAPQPEPAPPPPPAPAAVSILHASPDPAAATISIVDASGSPLAQDLTYRGTRPAIEIASGTTALTVRGIPSVETGEAPDLLTVEAQLEPGTAYSAILHGLPGGEPPLALVPVAGSSVTPPEGTAAIRFFHALVGLGALEVCRAGAAPRDPAIPVLAGVAPGSIAPSDGSDPALVPAGAELALQLRQPSDTACRGRVLGVARITPTAGAALTLVAVGRTTGAPRADRELLVCTGAIESPCTVVPISSR